MLRAAVAIVGIVGVALATSYTVAAERASTGWERRPGGVEVPRPRLDGGALRVLRSVAHPDGTMLPEARPSRGFDPHGLGVVLEGCTQVAPGRWAFRGRVQRPAALATEATIALGLSSGYDLMSPATVDVAVRADGPFTVVVDVPTRTPRKGLGRAAIALPHSGPLKALCALRVLDAPVPLAPPPDRPVEVVQEHSTDPVRYRAPKGSLQALGIMGTVAGAPARRVWLHRAWQGATLPFDTVWVPDPASGRAVESVEGRWYGGCGYVRVELAQGLQVSQFFHCDREGGDLDRRDTVIGPVAGAAGFVLRHSPDRLKWVAERVSGDERLRAAGNTRHEVEELARGLRAHRNGVVEPRPPGPHPPTFDQRMAADMRPGEEFRYRTYWEKGYIVVSSLVEQRGSGRPRTSMFIRLTDEAGVIRRTYGGEYAGCVYALHATSEPPFGPHPYTVLVAEHPQHAVQVKDPKRGWHTLPVHRGINVGSGHRPGPYRSVIHPTNEVVCQTAS